MTKKKNKKVKLLQKIKKIRIEKKIFFSLTLILLLGLGIFYAKIYPELYSLHEIYAINPDNRLIEIKPKDKIEIKFSRAIKKQEAEKSFSINPDIEGEITWKDGLSLGYAQTFVFTPKEYFNPDTAYKIKFGELESFYGTRKKESSYSFHTITSPKVKKITPEEGSIEKKLKPEIEVLVDKSSPYFNLLFELEPKTDLDINFDAKKLKYIITPKTSLSQETNYTFQIYKSFNLEPSTANNETTKNNKNILETIKNNFQTIPSVSIVDVLPEQGSQKNSQHSEIRISFNRPVDYKSAEENFSITPKVEGNLGWEEKTFVFEPKKLAANTEYKIEIKKGVKAHEDEGFTKDDFSYSFKTEINPKEVIPNVPIEPQIKEGKYIDVDISEQILTMFENGKSLGSYLVSTGKYGMPTPLGKFRVLNKSGVAYSNKYNLYMPFWMQFTSAGHGIHELPFWKYKGGAEYKERESHLGTRISHGCVRLGVGPAETVYKWADIGTPIIIHD